MTIPTRVPPRLVEIDRSESPSPSSPGLIRPKLAPVHGVVLARQRVLDVPNVLDAVRAGLVTQVEGLQARRRLVLVEMWQVRHWTPVGVVRRRKVDEVALHEGRDSLVSHRLHRPLEFERAPVKVVARVVKVEALALVEEDVPDIAVLGYVKGPAVTRRDGLREHDCVSPKDGLVKGRSNAVDWWVEDRSLGLCRRGQIETLLLEERGEELRGVVFCRRVDWDEWGTSRHQFLTLVSRSADDQGDGVVFMLIEKSGRNVGDICPVHHWSPLSRPSDLLGRSKKNSSAGLAEFTKALGLRQCQYVLKGTFSIQ